MSARSETNSTELGQPLMDYKEVAEYLSVPPKRVYELPIPQVRLGESTIRWRPSDVKDFLDERYVAVA